MMLDLDYQHSRYHPSSIHWRNEGHVCGMREFFSLDMLLSVCEGVS